MININLDLFRKFAPIKKLEIIKACGDKDLLSIRYDTVERILKEAGKRVSEHHTAKRLYLDRDLAGNGWNSNIPYLYNSKKEIYLDVYIQGYDTDVDDSVSLKDFLKGIEVFGSFDETYLNGGGSHIIARYDNHDRAKVIRAICIAYVINKYGINND